MIFHIEAADGAMSPMSMSNSKIFNMSKRLTLWFKEAIDAGYPKRASKKNTDYYPAMITLTYAEKGKWEPNHIRDYLQNVRSHYKRQGWGNPVYCWVAEMQKRGVIHYHIMIYIPINAKLPKPDESWWGYKRAGKTGGTDFTPWGSSKIEAVKHDVTRYLLKYLTKDGQTDYPKGARMYGMSKISTEAAIRIRYHMAPSYVRSMFPEVGDLQRVSGGWVNRDKNIEMLSNYKKRIIEEITGVKHCIMSFGYKWLFINNLGGKEHAHV